MYNLLGYSIPIFFAVIFIPYLINGLGKERFGILSLIWSLIGYSSFLDLGIGRGLTKVISEKIGLNQTDEIPTFFWTSLTLMFVVSFTICFVFIQFLPSALNKYLNVSSKIKFETYSIFLAVIISFPIITTTSALRGVLEAYQKFKTINLIRVILGISTFGVPLIVLLITNSLFWIVISLILVRILVWFAYLIFSFRINENILQNIRFSFKNIKPLLKFGFWISLANIVGPLVLYSDKFIIGVLLSATAITYYATPFEMITKLLIISSALVSVLFPVFSANFITNKELSIQIFVRAIKYVFMIVYPIVMVVIIFAKEIMGAWLGSDFSNHSYFILQILSIGILMNSLSVIPNIFFQGAGKPKIPTLLNLLELPFYLLIMWLMIKNFGIKGAAITYMIMAAVDTIAMYFMSFSTYSLRIRKRYLFIIFISLCLLLLAFQINFLMYKFIFVVLFLILFLVISWIYFLSRDERRFIYSKIPKFFMVKN